jgi:hypothetical protein
MFKRLSERDSEIYEKGFSDGYARAKEINDKERLSAELELQEYKSLEKLNWKERIHIEMGQTYGTLVLDGHVFHVYLADVESEKIGSRLLNQKKCDELKEYANKFVFVVR